MEHTPLDNLLRLSIYCWGYIDDFSPLIELAQGGVQPSWEWAHIGQNFDVPEKSDIEKIVPTQLSQGMQLRHSLVDTTVLRGREGSRVRQNNGRLVVRNGLLLHFAYRERCNIDPTVNLHAELERRLALIKGAIAELSLEVDSGGVLIEHQESVRLERAWSQLLQHGLDICAADTSQGCLGVVLSDFQEEFLLSMRLKESTADNLVDRWYYHWLTCEASRTIMSGQNTALDYVSNAIALSADYEGTVTKQHFLSAVATRRRVSVDRAGLIALKFRHSIIEDFRASHDVDGNYAIQTQNEEPTFTPIDSYVLDLQTYIRREYKMYFADSVRIMIGLQEDALNRAERDAQASVELFNMSYNTQIQAILYRLQWIALAISLLSLIVAAIAIRAT